MPITLQEIEDAFKNKSWEPGSSWPSEEYKTIFQNTIGGLSKASFDYGNLYVYTPSTITMTTIPYNPYFAEGIYQIEPLFAVGDLVKYIYAKKIYSFSRKGEEIEYSSGFVSAIDKDSLLYTITDIEHGETLHIMQHSLYMVNKKGE